MHSADCAARRLKCQMLSLRRQADGRLVPAPTKRNVQSLPEGLPAHVLLGEQTDCGSVVRPAPSGRCRPSPLTPYRRLSPTLRGCGLLPRSSNVE